MFRSETHSQISRDQRPPIVLWSLASVLWMIEFVWRIVSIGGHRPIDFMVYRGGAEMLLAGHSPYHAHFTSIGLNFTYPPFALLCFTALTLLPLAVTIVGWWLVNSLALVGVCYLAIGEISSCDRGRRSAGAALLAGVATAALEPLRSSVGFGQVNFLIMLLVAFDILRPRSRWRGTFVGLASAIKMTPLAYAPFFLATRDRAATVRAFGSFAVLSLASALVLFHESSVFWFHQGLSPAHKGGAIGAANQSEYSVVSVLLGSSSWSKIVWFVLALGTISVGYATAVSCWRRSKRLDALIVLSLSELLVSPISWSHHWSWIVLLPLLVYSGWGRDRAVVFASVLVLLVGVTFPYHHHDWSWYSHGAWRTFQGFTLVGAGTVLLLTLAIRELMDSQRTRGAESDEQRRRRVESSPNLSAA